MEAFPLQLSAEAATGEILDALLECVAAGTRTSNAGTLRATPAASEPPAVQDHAHDSLLGALAALDGSTIGWLHAQCSGIEVFIDRDGGRVCAESVDMLKIAAPRAGREGWTAVPHPSLQTGAPRRLASSALDSFLLTAALAARSTLPALSPLRFQLRQWPDLGGMPEAVDALRVVRAIQSRRLTEAEIRETTGVEETSVRACLYAFRAAGLVRSEPTDATAARPTEVAAAAASSRTPTRVLHRLARWVGLGRRSEGTVTSPDTGSKSV